MTVSPLPAYDHIVVVVEESHGYTGIIGNAEANQINALASGGALLESALARGLAPTCYTCPYRILRPAVFMMKSAEDRPRGEWPEPLDRSIGRRILAQ